MYVRTNYVLIDTLSVHLYSDVLEGYESTVFAYGQTGTGKTFTMEGDLENPLHYGVIPRSTEAIFQALESNMFVSHRVACSYLEIYNEELCDLLADEDDGPKNKLEIRNGKNGTFCKCVVPIIILLDVFFVHCINLLNYPIIAC